MRQRNANAPAAQVLHEGPPEFGNLTTIYQAALDAVIADIGSLNYDDPVCTDDKRKITISY